MIKTAFGPLQHALCALGAGLLPTLLAMLSQPWILFQPTNLGRLFFAHVWESMGDDINEGRRVVKEDLIRSRAHGVVLDLGAGHGHSIEYLNLTRVTKYIALEPNVLMHPKILSTALSFGLRPSQIMLLPYGLEDLPSLLSSIPPHSVNTVLSILVLCSIPNPFTTLPAFINTFLAPKGKLLLYEHVSSELEEARWWQRAWTPLWKQLFDGCRLDRETIELVRSVGGWKSEEIWGKEGEDKETLFCHRVGVFVRE